ncbi:MAG: hypothetical protein AAFV07_10880, partial [Bacteroidota bacterium]
MKTRYLLGLGAFVMLLSSYRYSHAQTPESPEAYRTFASELAMNGIVKRDLLNYLKESCDKPVPYWHALYRHFKAFDSLQVLGQVKP